MFTATVLALHTATATQDVALVTLTAFSARMGTVQGGSEVGAGGRACTGANLIMAELWTWQS